MVNHLWEWCFSRASSSYEDLQIVKEIYLQFFLLRMWGRCGILDSFPSTTNNVRSVREVRQRRRALDTV
jgi:hypothetical protein